jgi:hypothetical protein
VTICQADGKPCELTVWGVEIDECGRSGERREGEAGRDEAVMVSLCFLELSYFDWGSVHVADQGVEPLQLQAPLHPQWSWRLRQCHCSELRRFALRI